jgi:excisionase family DNA binding protein
VSGKVAPAQDLLSLEEAANRLGVHYMTAYRYVRLGRLAAEQQSGRWWVRSEDLESLEASNAKPGRGDNPVRWQIICRRLIARLVEGDASGSWAIVEQTLTRGASPADIYMQLLAPTLRLVGDGWAQGTLSVEEEHTASAIANRIVGRMGHLFNRRGTPRSGTILLGGAPGDPHLLPLAMVSDVLRSSGFKVLELGADVPHESFVESAHSMPNLRAVGISLSDSQCVNAAANVISSVREIRPDLLILAGGPALTNRESALEIGADDWASDAVESVLLFDSGSRLSFSGHSQ